MRANELLAAMDTLTHGVYVIGTHTQKGENLMTAAWLCQVSMKPPTVMVAVSKGHYTAELLQEGGRFSVSVLTPAQRDVALHCGRVSGRQKNKLEGVDVAFSEDGLPFVKGSAAHLTCELRDTFAVTDHLLFIGEVVAAKAYSEETLRYHRAKFF
ncbi:MAG: flavin reductase family protein [Christensenellales bacterium]|jgi:flavin reductase (DIM6/NTAB) family NADH-FMN oxidoreductase RutF